MIGPRGMRACLLLAVAGALGLAACGAPPPPEPFPIPEYAEVYEIVDALADGDAAALSMHFSDTLKQDTAPDDLIAEWAALTTRYGAFLGIDDVQGRTIETSHFGELTTVTVTCSFANANTAVGVVLNEDNKLFSLATPQEYTP